MNLQDYDWDRLAGLGFTEEATGDLKQACWKGYTAVGMKTKNGKKVPNCVPVKKKDTSDHKEGDVATAEMTPNYLPAEPIPGGGDEKNPEMGEHEIRMPRDTVLKKLEKRSDEQAMKVPPNTSKHSEDFSDSMNGPFLSSEPNGRMAINQLRVMREKIDILLGMLYPDDNLEPWMATKLAMSAQNLASVADYMRFGAEL